MEQPVRIAGSLTPKENTTHILEGSTEECSWVTPPPRLLFVLTLLPHFILVVITLCRWFDTSSSTHARPHARTHNTSTFSTLLFCLKEHVNCRVLFPVRSKLVRDPCPISKFLLLRFFLFNGIPVSLQVFVKLVYFQTKLQSRQYLSSRGFRIILHARSVT
jgi:hypothetical protein